ncbi:MAG TPA: ABC transporter permease subunit [Polyangia bacterium]|nr:ABC transporter permease subunit [Polyangia bacterium]
MKPAVVQAARYVALVLLVLAVGVVLLVGGMRYIPPVQDIPVEVRRLPGYAAWSFLRMLIAYVFALAFSVSYGYVAATNRRAERVLMPLLDILQSVPVLGFFPAAVFFFVNLTHGSRLGVEMASIFLIFTSQAWNIAFGCYEAITTIPQDSFDALASQGVRGWRKFRTLYLPACVPKLVYNSILSWAGGWYFLIACEILTIGPSTQALPGLGSFLKRASAEGKTGLTLMGIGVLIFIVVAMHLVIWRPLESWSEKFRYEFAASTVTPSRMLRFWRDFPPLLALRRAWKRAGTRASVYWARVRPAKVIADLEAPPPMWRRVVGRIVQVLSIAFSLYVLYRAGRALVTVLRPPWPRESVLIPAALGASFLRLLVAYVVALAWTIPVAVWAGTRPRAMRVVGPFAQIASSVPATSLFPLIVMFVIHHRGGTNVAAVLLVLTGMQWYLLFNLLAGVHAIPGDLREATRSLGLTGWKQFRTLTLPAMLPSLITGSITGWGGGWNALIVSEYLYFGGATYKVLGIGAMLQESTEPPGNQAMMVLSLVAMVVVIVFMNRLFWRRLYNVAADRFKIEY